MSVRVGRTKRRRDTWGLMMNDQDVVCNLVTTLARFKMFNRITLDVWKRTKFKPF